MLLAAKYLAETRNFDGTAVLAFRSPEDDGAGGKAMVDDGLTTRLGIRGLRHAPRPGAAALNIKDHWWNLVLLVSVTN
jgi:hypothetical protein